MILGESDENEFMADVSNNLQYNEDCYSDLAYNSRPIKLIDLNNNNINQSTDNQESSNQSSIQQINRHHIQQLNQTSPQFNQQNNHLNLVQFVDQFSNFSCNSLVPSLSTQQQQQQQQQQQTNISNQQMIYSNDQQSKESNTIDTGNNGVTKIKSENAIDAIDLSNSTNIPNSSNSSSNLTNLSNDLNNLSGITSGITSGIPTLLPNTLNLHSINLSNCDTLHNHNIKCSNLSNNGSSINNHNLPVNLPANFNELLLNDYQLNTNQLDQQCQQTQQNQLNSNVISLQSNVMNKNQTSNLDQSNKISNSNNNGEMSPIDMKDQEKIKLERKRLRNRIAASKCRKKKMETLQSLEELVKQLRNENAKLMRLVQDLKEMNYQLKQEVISHMTRGCNIKTTI